MTQYIDSVATQTLNTVQYTMTVFEAVRCNIRFKQSIEYVTLDDYSDNGCDLQEVLFPGIRIYWD